MPYGSGSIDADPGRLHALIVDHRLIVGDLGPFGRAQDILVDERKVGDVEKVLDDAGAARVDHVRAAKKVAETAIVPLGKGRHIVRRVAEADQPTIALEGAIGLDAGLARRRRVGQRRDADALPVRIIDPAVIGALQRTTIDPAEREPRAAVHAQVLPGERPSVGLPDDDVLTQEPCADKPAPRERVAAHDRMPIVDKDGSVITPDNSNECGSARPEGWPAGQLITSQKLAEPSKPDWHRHATPGARAPGSPSPANVAHSELNGVS